MYNIIEYTLDKLSVLCYILSFNSTDCNHSKFQE